MKLDFVKDKEGKPIEFTLLVTADDLVALRDKERTAKDRVEVVTAQANWLAPVLAKSLPPGDYALQPTARQVRHAVRKIITWIFEDESSGDESPLE